MSSSADAHFKLGVVARAGSWASRHRRTVLIGATMSNLPIIDTRGQDHAARRED
jgi:hypothetical protein